MNSWLHLIWSLTRLTTLAFHLQLDRHEWHGLEVDGSDKAVERICCQRSRGEVVSLSWCLCASHPLAFAPTYLIAFALHSFDFGQLSIMWKFWLFYWGYFQLVADIWFAVHCRSFSRGCLASIIVSPDTRWSSSLWHLGVHTSTLVQTDWLIYHFPFTIYHVPQNVRQLLW